MHNDSFKKKTTNLKRKKKRNAIISVVLILTLLISCIYAFLFDKDSKVNKFTVGNVNVKLTETKWDPEKAENIVPGDVIDKNPQVKNIGRNNAYVYLVVGMPVENWDTVYTGNGSYNGVGTHIDDVTLTVTPGDIIVKAYGIQENYNELTDSEDLWNTFVNNTGIEKMLGSRATDEDRIEIFTWEGLDTTNWTQMNILTSASDTATTNVYKSSDGHNYYFFRYNNSDGNALLSINGTTSELFTHVKLIDDIGEKKVKPFNVNFFMRNGNSEINMDGEDISNYELLCTNTYQKATSIGDLPITEKNCIEGCLVSSKIADIENNTVYITSKEAYSNMVVDGPTNIVIYNSIDYNIDDAAKYLVFNIDEASGSKSDPAGVTVCGIETHDSECPTTPSTVIVPQYVKLKCIKRYYNGYYYEETFKILNGYSGYNLIGNTNFDADSFYMSRGCTLIFPADSIHEKFKISDDEYLIPVVGINNSMYGSDEISTVAKELKLPETITDVSINSSTSSVLEKINIPTLCQTMSLCNNPSLTSVRIPGTIKNIPDNCFANTGIEELNIPNSIQTIGSEAFINSKIKSITIPAFVKKIKNNGLAGIDIATFESKDTILYNEGGTSALETLGCNTIKINCELDEFKISNLYTSLKYADGITSYNSIIFNDITLTNSDKQYCSSCGKYYWTELGCYCNHDNALYINNELIHVKYKEIPSNFVVKEGTVKIGNKVFNNLKTQLTGITMPDTVTEIGSYAFYGCEKLASVTLSNNLTYIGEAAFSNCNTLLNITVPSSVSYVGINGFYRYANSFSNIRTFTISQTTYNNIISITSSAFGDETRDVFNFV